MSTNLKVIDWEGALDAAQRDEGFLFEVLDDLFNETAEGVLEIQNAIEAKDFVVVRKAAHRMKGSASYLCCHDLQNVCFQLQNAGDIGERGAEKPDQLWKEIIVMFNDLKDALNNLNAEVSARQKK